MTLGLREGRTGALMFAAVFLAGPVAGQTTDGTGDPAMGVTEALARERGARLSDLRYRLSFAIPADRGAPIAAHQSMTFTLGGAPTPLAIDFSPARPAVLRQVEAAGRPIAVRQVNGHVIVPASALQAGRNVLTFDFDAGDAPLHRDDDFVYTIFVPARAHEAFPCFDQPDLKARWTLSLDVPEGWESIANGAEVSRVSRGGRTQTTFAETEPISTYLFAFGAGKFSVERAELKGRTLRMFHRETDVQKVARNRDAIFNLHAAAIDWMERYTAIAYPFGKFDFLLVPSFQFGGMEHPGAIFYDAAGLLLDESATENQKLDRASVISHETAHMWFGDLVTMRWFSDVWMKEVFANFLAAKIVNPSFPGVNHDLRFLLAHYPLAYGVDRSAGTNAIRQRLDNLSEAGSLYGAIIYQKAPIVMRQLEMLLGADNFRDGLREYLGRYSLGNASWPDVIEILDGRTPEDLVSWSHAWVNERGRPRVTTALTVEGGRISRLTLTERDPYPRRGLTWTQELQVALGYRDGQRLIPVHLSGGSVDVKAAQGLPAPDFVLPSGGGLGYGEFHLDARSLQWLARELPAVDDPLTRGSAWVTLWDAMLNAEVPADRVIELALGALPRETNELTSQRILGYLRDAYWRFTAAAPRRALAPRVEDVLRRGLATAPTASLKSAYFSTLRDVALTPPTLGWLTSVWREEERVPGVPLAEPDYVVLAEELAVRAVPGWQSILAQQIERTKNPDRRARLRFVAPALSADGKERDRFFASLGHIENRRHEAWVLDGVRYLHHPLRAGLALKYVRPSLDLLDSIQRTGDIFFPKRWVDATLGGHRSAAAARVVRTFLAGVPPTYPDHLRRVVLSAADELFRAAR